MNIDRLDLIAFGHLSDVSLDLSAVPHRFHLIAGSNESGKSTSLRAINAWLYGFPVQTPDAYAFPMAQLRVGGVVRDGDQRLACIRRKGNRKTLRDGDDFSVEIGEDRLSAMLHGVDRDTFATQYALDHEELLRGGEEILRGGGDIGELLFAAGAGLGRLKKIAGDLRDDQQRLFRSRGGNAIADATKKLRTLKSELKHALVPPAEFARLSDEIDKQVDRIAELKRGAERFAGERSRLVAAIETLPLIPRWRDIGEQLADLADAPRLDAGFADRRRELSASLRVADESVDRLERNWRTLRTKAESLDADSSITRYRDEIEVIYRELAAREEAESHRTGHLTTVLRAQERDLRRGLVDLTRDLGQPQPELDTDSDLLAHVERLQLSDQQRNRFARLAQSYDTLIARRDDAAMRIKRHDGKIRSAIDERESLPAPNNIDAVRGVIAEIGSPSAMDIKIHEAAVRCDRQRKRCDDLRRRLHWNGSSEDLAAVVPPDEDTLAKVTARIAQFDRDQELNQHQRDSLVKRLASQAAEKKALPGNHELPTQADLERSRRHRDRLIADAADRTDIEAAVRKADEVVDRLRAHHGTVHQRETLATAIERLTAERDAIDNNLRVIEERRARETESWKSLWARCGVVAQSPAAMETWLARHAEWVDQYEILLDHRAERAAAESALAVAKDRLCSVLVESDQTGANSLVHLSLPELHDRASSMVGQSESVTRRRDLLRDRIDAQRGERAEAAGELDAAEAAIADWQVQWDAATTSLAADCEPADAIPILDSIANLSKLKRDREVTMQRMRSISQDTTTYLGRVSRLIDLIVGDDRDGGVADSLQNLAPEIHRLHQRLVRATSDAEAREQVIREAEVAEAEYRGQRDKRSHLQALLGELCIEAGCDNAADLPGIEERSLRRRELEGEIKRIEIDLRRLAAGQPIEAFTESICEADRRGEIGAERLPQIEQEHRACLDDLGAAQTELGRLQQQRSAMDGGETATVLSQEIQSLRGQIRRDAESYVRLKLADGLLRAAIEHYRSENQEPVLKFAEDYFRELTLGRYRALRVEFDDRDRPRLHGVGGGGDLVPAGGMSDGTTDALYLALRLASLKHQAADGRTMPLIVDDCLIQLDNARAVAALKVFSDLSLTNQVILFTHHDHLLDLAADRLAEGSFHVHHLDELKASAKAK